MTSSFASADCLQKAATAKDGRVGTANFTTSCIKNAEPVDVSGDFHVYGCPAILHEKVAKA